ncbi:MAG: hypothetical protein P1Q69_17890, partial [Candidatus Thorarchaeota archaeon]|nr:hypothetical protein [Candidatus Thorarchaeota archaeon]
MNLLALGYHVYPPRLSEHELNAKTWKALSRFFTKIDVVGQSSERTMLRDRMGNVELIGSPRTGIRILDVLLFAITAFLWGLRSIATGTKIIECSELAIAGPVGVLLGKLCKCDVIADVQGEVLTLQTNTHQ